MSPFISCPHCQQPLNLPASLVATQVRCPRCKQVFTLPVARPAVVATSPSVVPAPGRVAATAPQPIVSTPCCPACQAPLSRGALACLECGHLLAKSSPPAPRVPLSSLPPKREEGRTRQSKLPSPPPLEKRHEDTVTSSRLDFRQWPPALRLLPAGLLVVILLLFMVRDRFVGGATTDEEPETTVVELPLDLNPLLDLQFHEPGFGLTMFRAIPRMTSKSWSS
jgi:phage FluMu protein Com